MSKHCIALCVRENGESLTRLWSVLLLLNAPTIHRPQLREGFVECQAVSKTKLIVEVSTMLSPMATHTTCMAGRYSIEELLQLKDLLPVVVCSVKHVNKQIDIGKFISRHEYKSVLLKTFYSWCLPAA